MSVAVVGKTIPLQIHEFVAQNTRGIRDEAGDREDWVELLNAGMTAADISGYFLTDDLTVPKKWVFPQGTVIPAGGTLLVWADDEPAEGPLHASFKLSSAGDTIAVLDRSGTRLLDSLTFGTQRDNVSTGRPFGYNMWLSFETPSPGRINLPHPSGHLNYDGLNASVSELRLTGNGHAGASSQVWYDISGAPRQTAGLMAASIGPWHSVLGSLGTLLVNPVAMALLPIGTDATGKARLTAPVPDIPGLKRQLVFVQVIVLNGNGGGLSNGVMTRMWH
jgi:hypothetical protein